MAVSKNNPGIRQEVKKRYYQGQEVRPAKYMGRASGHGTYMAGSVNGEIIVDANGKPIPWRAIPWDQKTS